MIDGTKIPGNWANFLKVDENKRELFSLLSSILHNSFQLVCKELVITEGDDLNRSLLSDIAALAYCIHQEANGYMILHATHAAHNGHHEILICAVDNNITVDNDIIVFAVILAHTLEE